MLTPEMTGTMRSRLGGEAAGEIFEPRGILDAPSTELSAEWETPESEEATDSVFMSYADGAADSSGARGWESNDSAAESFEPESRHFIDETTPEVDSRGGGESPQWDEPQSAAHVESRVIPQPRIVRSMSSSRDVHSDIGAIESSQRPTGSSSMEESAYSSEDSSPAKTHSRISHPSERMVSKPEIEPLKSEQIFWKSPSQLVGFLISYDYDPLGSYVELRKGRLLVTSEADASGNCLIVDHDTVSPMHAVMRIADGGAVQVLDQLSEYGTRIVRGGVGQDAGEEVLLSGDKASIRNGDILCFGERKFHVCLVTAG
jgi:hypothetical protein